MPEISITIAFIEISLMVQKRVNILHNEESINPLDKFKRL